MGICATLVVLNPSAHVHKGGRHGDINEAAGTHGACDWLKIKSVEMDL